MGRDSLRTIITDMTKMEIHRVIQLPNDGWCDDDAVGAKRGCLPERRGYSASASPTTCGGADWSSGQIVSMSKQFFSPTQFCQMAN